MTVLVDTVVICLEKDVDKVCFKKSGIFVQRIVSRLWCLHRELCWVTFVVAAFIQPNSSVSESSVQIL